MPASSRQEPHVQYDPAKVEDVLQLGGIRTGTLDYPNPNGGQSCRVAFVNTGGGLRFTVAIDRGGDLVEADFKSTNLAFLTRNGYKPPSHAYSREYEWLKGWPGGLLTTGGPELMGEPRIEDNNPVPLHGRFSNIPASVDSIVNPDLRAARTVMAISMTIQDIQMFGPNIEVKRTISCRLGGATIVMNDTVANLGNEPCRHALLYHVTLGYPLVDSGSRIICSGPAKGYFQFSSAKSNADFAQLKVIPPNRSGMFGDYDPRGGMFIAEPVGDERGQACVGIVNEERAVGLELTYPVAAMPRVGNWQYFGDGGGYLAAFEPFSGSIFGKERDTHPSAALTLQPGESLDYAMSIRALEGAQEIRQLLERDGPLLA